MSMVFWSWLINLYGNRKIGNHFVSMELIIWCKHCFVFIPSYHLHACLHSRTPIRIFARLSMPQVKILLMSWFVGIGCIGWVFPTVISGVLCRHSESLSWVRNKSWNQDHQHLQNPERSTAIFIKIKHMFRDVQKGKIGYSSAPLSLLSNSSRINILGDPCKKLQPNLWVSPILKSARDSLHQQSKKA
jgi:hypothetical protein